MKDYERYVVWLDYFDSELKREQGRRVPLNTATRVPKLEELEEACKRLNLQPSPQAAAYPDSAPKKTGYVSVRKVKPKQALVLRIAKELSIVRGLAQKKAQQQQNPKK